MPLRSHNPVALALYANAAVLAAILLVLLHGTRFPETLPAAMAQSQPVMGGSGGVFVVPAQFRAESFGCYLVDVDAQTICAYEYDPGGQLKLLSARDFRYDRMLKNFATTPAPWEVEQLVEQEKQMPRPAK